MSTQAEIIKQSASVIPFVIKTAIICGIGVFAYRAYTNRFVTLRENRNYDPANVSQSQAESRAIAIASSIGFFSNSFAQVSSNLAGLNYNGFIRVYNAFGEETGTLLGGKLNLIEWCKNQFTDYEISQLRLLFNGQFF